jgi:hypothetical protein
MNRLLGGGRFVAFLDSCGVTGFCGRDDWLAQRFVNFVQVDADCFCAKPIGGDDAVSDPISDCSDVDTDVSCGVRI